MMNKNEQYIYDLLEEAGEYGISDDRIDGINVTYQVHQLRDKYNLSISTSMPYPDGEKGDTRYVLEDDIIEAEYIMGDPQEAECTEPSIHAPKKSILKVLFGWLWWKV